MIEEKSCKTCNFSFGFKDWTTHHHYFCRRYPPDSQSTYPLITLDNWCGEWQERCDE